MSNITKNSKKIVNTNVAFKKHPLFNIICDVIFAALYNIEKNRAVSVQQFKREVLSKKDNLIEYYKALIKFANQ